MRSHSNSKQNKTKQHNITLEMHPQLQIKLQLGRLIDSKFNTHTTLFKSHKNKLNNCLIDNIQQYQSVPYSSFKKYQLQSTPRRTPRKRMKVKPHQSQGEQKTLKTLYQLRLQDLKNRFFNQKKEKNKIFSLNRTNSHLSITNTHPIEAQNHDQTITHRNNTAQKIQFKNFIRSQGKQKMVDNIAYMRKLKAKIELISLSTIMAQRIETKKQLSPCVKSIKSIELSESIKQKQIKKRGETASYYSRISNKKNKAFKIQQKRATEAEYRPWSGMKMEFTNELITYL